MHEQLPLEQIVVHRREPLQHLFATRAVEVVPASEDYVLEPVREGLRVRAANETALDLPAEILRQAFGEDLAFRPVTVTMQQHHALTYEPWMFVRSEIRADAQPLVRDALCARAATILEEDKQRTNVVTRALAAQRNLLGFPAVVREKAGDDARLWIWLSHYAPVGA
ncbi:MAG: hypothetical protein ABI619_00230 [Betaproteobacteria bacterium]